MNFVMNEKKFAEDLLNGDGYGSNPSSSTVIMAKYFKSLGQSNKNIRKSLNELIDERLSSGSVCSGLFWHKTKEKWIDKALSIAGRYPLYEFDKIVITKPEMAVVNSLHSEKFRDYRIRRLAFALLCFAKFEEKRSKNDGWINIDAKDIFVAADLKGLTTTKQNLLIHELKELGLVYVSPVIGSGGLRILCMHEGETEIVVDNMNEVGKIFRQYNGEKIIRCDKCGRLVYATGRRMKYCSNCAAIVDKEKRRERHREVLKSQNADL